MTLFEQILSGVVKKDRLDSNVSPVEWLLIHMGWSLEINKIKKNELTANEKKINFMGLDLLPISQFVTDILIPMILDDIVYNIDSVFVCFFVG